MKMVPIHKSCRAACAILITWMLALSLTINARADALDPQLQAVLQSRAANDKIPVIITLSDKADVTSVPKGAKHLRRAGLVRLLKSKAEKAQAPLKASLKSEGAERLVSLWIINGIAAKLRPATIKKLAARPDIESIQLDGTLTIPEVTYGASAPPEWNIDAVRAPALWSLGYTGEGVVVASLDTGVDPYHPDLGARWRGGANSWFDPNGEHAAPYDADGHGTQTMGIMIGGSTGGTAIGMAPGAQWIAAKIFNDLGIASLSGIHQAFQWLLDPDGDLATDDAPDVVNNSWGLSSHVGECIPEFQTDVQVLKAAGIAVVFAGGNAGPFPYTSVSPASYPESFAAGAVDSSGTVDFFSSRGPSACDGSIYPEVSAPGVNVKTTDLTYGFLFDSYTYVSGTSYAAPHVSGTIALLLSAAPGATISEIESALKQSCVDLGQAGPDNDYGYGLIDVLAAYQALQSSSCTDSDGDGFFAQTECGTAMDCSDSDASVFPGASEIKHDGIDQDCNGYDLTIEIASAFYRSDLDKLVVYATSALGANAALKVDIPGIGSKKMTWSIAKQRWQKVVKGASDKGFDPLNAGQVTVSGVEGSEARAIEMR